MSYCFLFIVKGDGIASNYDTLKPWASISKSVGGVSMVIPNVHVSESYVRGLNGYSNDSVPRLRNSIGLLATLTKVVMRGRFRLLCIWIPGMQMYSTSLNWRNPEGELLNPTTREKTSFAKNSASIVSL